MTPQSSDLPHLPHETSGTPTKEDLRPEVLFGKLSLASPQELTQVASLLRDVSRRYYTDIDGLSKLSGLQGYTLQTDTSRAITPGRNVYPANRVQRTRSTPFPQDLYS